MRNETKSYWMETTPKTHYSKLKGPLSVDVAVVGAGIAGLTAALLLKRAGKKVAVLEQHHVAAMDSGFTTAHITEIIDTSYDTLISTFGRKGARLVAESNRAAIERIAQFVREEGISCDFKRVPAFLYAEETNQVRQVEKEFRAVKKVGLRASWTNELPLPFPIQGAIRFEDQAQFHPRKYLLALAEKIQGDGSHIFENTRAVNMQDGSPCLVRTEDASVHADQLVVTTHSPSANKVFLQTKVAPYRTYVVAVRLKKPLEADGLFWDAADPYHYIRNHNGVWIIGGEDHKTGHKENTEESFVNLRRYVDSHFSVESFQDQWSGQVFEPVDGLPYIGLDIASKNLFIATGFSGNGMTFGTISGMLLSDLVIGKANPWAKLYRPGRHNLLASAKYFFMENKDYPICLIKDRITPADVSSVEEIRKGEGKTIRYRGQKLAVYRDDQDEIHSVSAVCTHLGCYVHWNNAEKSWDCPCHGSRFDVDGDVLNGPATSRLKPVQIPGAEKERKRRAA